MKEKKKERGRGKERERKRKEERGKMERVVVCDSNLVSLFLGNCC